MSCASLPYMSICAWIVVSVPLKEIDYAPNTKPRTKGDNESLQYSNRLIEKFHIYLTFCRVLRL